MTAWIIKTKRSITNVGVSIQTLRICRIGYNGIGTEPAAKRRVVPPRAYLDQLNVIVLTLVRTAGSAAAYSRLRPPAAESRTSKCISAQPFCGCETIVFLCRPPKSGGRLKYISSPKIGFEIHFGLARCRIGERFRGAGGRLKYISDAKTAREMYFAIGWRTLKRRVNWRPQTRRDAGWPRWRPESGPAMSGFRAVTRPSR